MERYLLQLSELLVSLVDLPLLLADAHLYDVLGEGLPFVLFDDGLADCDVDVVPTRVWHRLLPDGDGVAVALFEVDVEGGGLDELAAVGALHRLAVLHQLLEVLHLLILLLQHLRPGLHFLQSGGETLVGLNELVVVVAF